MNSKNPIQTHFALKKPCGNCPFKVQGAIQLEDGRLDEIISNLVDDDHSTFKCHKTVHGVKGGDWNDEGEYMPSGRESMCVGAMVYLEKMHRPTVGMRLGQATGYYDPKKFEQFKAEILTPEPNHSASVKMVVHMNVTTKEMP